MSEIEEIPSLWYYTTADHSGAWSVRDGAWIDNAPPALTRAFATEVELAEYLRAQGVRGPAPTDDDVRDEYLRRLVLLYGARSVGHVGFIRADDAIELDKLRALANPSADDTARMAEMEARDAAVNALIDAYNAIPSPPPADYTADPYWPAIE